MMSLPHTVKIYVASRPEDMRKSFNGLSACVKNRLETDPLSGHLFVFFNTRRDLVKVLFWDRSGFAIFQKRLERGCFHLPEQKEGETHVNIEAAQLALILEGIDLHNARHRKRWTPAAA